MRPVRRRRDRRPLAASTATSIPAHPYRDSAILHGVLAGAIVVIALVTSVNLETALVVAPLYFVAATAWSWLRFSQRIRRVRSAETASESESPS